MSPLTGQGLVPTVVSLSIARGVVAVGVVAVGVVAVEVVQMGVVGVEGGSSVVSWSTASPSIDSLTCDPISQD